MRPVNIPAATQTGQLGLQDNELDQNLLVYEMIRISCQISQQHTNKCYILSMEVITDYQGHANLLDE